MALFQDYLGEPVPEESFFGLYGARYGDSRVRHTANPAGRHSIQTNQQPTSIPHFCAGCPFYRNAPNLSWLGTGTKCAGLHTQCLG